MIHTQRSIALATTFLFLFGVMPLRAQADRDGKTRSWFAAMPNGSPSAQPSNCGRTMASE